MTKKWKWIKLFLRSKVQMSVLHDFCDVYSQSASSIVNLDNGTWPWTRNFLNKHLQIFSQIFIDSQFDGEWLGTKGKQ